MLVKEYCEIKKDGKTIVSKSSPHNIVYNFVKAMKERGYVSLSFFSEKENNKINDISAYVDWSDDFTSEDMFDLSISYLRTLQHKERANFVSQLQNFIISEMLTEDEPE